MEEVWKPVVGYESRYEVSNIGRVRSFRLLKGSHDCQDGYIVVGLYNDKGSVNMKRVHRLVAEAFLGKSNLQVNHKDFNKTNNNIMNLEFLTLLENVRHARLNKPFWLPIDSKHFNSKISFTELVEILFMRELGVPTEAISIGYGIRKDYVKGLKRRTSYSSAMQAVHTILP